MSPTSQSQHAPNFRVTALAGVAVLAVALPLTAAMAEPTESEEPVAVGAADGRRDPAASRRAGAVAESAPSSSGQGRPTEFGFPSVAGGGPSAGCGPEVTSPLGVEAQTCVLAADDTTWGRTYYRNTSGGALRGVLTLMRPDGRTLQVHCVLPASTEPGMCETPQQRTVHPVGSEHPYSAVAEVEAPDGDQLLLRAGSNSPEDRVD